MNDPRRLLIAIRLGLGLGMLAACVACCYGFSLATNDLFMVGAVPAAGVTFAVGVFFCESALDAELWAPLKPDALDDDPNKTQVD